MGQSESKESRSALNAGLIEQEFAGLNQTRVLVEVRDSVGSTNEEVLTYLSQLDSYDVIILTADEQTAGRGRLDRTWSSPWAAGIALTIAVPVASVSGDLTSVPLRAGLAVQRALQNHGVTAQVKWPNDIVTDQGHKLGGLLSVARDQAVLVGIGLNVSLTSDELPTEMATSLALLGHNVSREKLIAGIVHEFQHVLTQGDWLADYESVSATLGQQVKLHRQGLPDVQGTVIAFAFDGSIKIATTAGTEIFSIGDVEHLRPT